MPIPYADLRVDGGLDAGTALSGKPLDVTWTVANRGIGITDAGEWSDSVWLSANADGSGTAWDLGSASHIGQLARRRQLHAHARVDAARGHLGHLLPQRRARRCRRPVRVHLHAATTPASSVAVAGDALAVARPRRRRLTAPAAAKEGALVDITWTVLNQGAARADGHWIDSVHAGAALGHRRRRSCSAPSRTTAALDAGIRYTRTEQVRLPAQDRRRVPGARRHQQPARQLGTQVYEHGAARNNNATCRRAIRSTSALNAAARPARRRSSSRRPASPPARRGGQLHRHQPRARSRPAASGRDHVYLSLDGTLSGDDVLVGRSTAAPRSRRARATVEPDAPSINIPSASAATPT